MKTLRTLLLDQLAEMYEAEQRIAAVLSKMARLAAHEPLRQALQDHAYESVGHVSKVAGVFECFGETPAGMRGAAIGGLLDEAESLVAGNTGDQVMDASLTSLVEKLEHYEIATYSCLRDWARVLENYEAESRLREILEEEQAGVRRMTRLVETSDLETFESAPDFNDGNRGGRKLAHSHGPRADFH